MRKLIPDTPVFVKLIGALEKRLEVTFTAKICWSIFYFSS